MIEDDDDAEKEEEEEEEEHKIEFTQHVYESWMDERTTNEQIIEQTASVLFLSSIDRSMCVS
jgi:hypothetical protein